MLFHRAASILRCLLLPLHGNVAENFCVILKHLLVCLAALPLIACPLSLRPLLVQASVMMTFAGLVTASVPKHLACVQKAALDFVW